MSELFEKIKQIGSDGVFATDLTAVMYGTVTSVTPLEIRVEQKITLKKEQLTLTWAVVDHVVDITVDHLTESSSCGIGGPHIHPVIGRKTIIIHNNLRVGEKVVLMREQGGQRFVVLDRAVAI